jgi:hypothetical protein
MSTPHSDDEALSAALDGDAAGAAAAAHAATCDQCRARLAELDAVRTAVGAAVPAPDAVTRARAIAAALDAHVASPASAGRDIGLAARKRTGSNSGRRLPLLAAAAVLVALLVAVPVLIDRTVSNSHTNSKATTLAGSGALDGGDLGAQQDPQALAAVVRSAVNEGQTADAVNAAGGSPGGQSAPGGASGAATTTPGPVQGTPSAARALTNTPPCQSATRSKYGKGTGVLAYTATLTWQGQPAVLLAYPLVPPAGSFRYRAFVVARSTCDLLTVLSL